jgi:hypothetical protein
MTRRGHRSIRWTKREIVLLKVLYPVLSTKEVARRVKRTPAACERKALAFGLKKSEKRLSEMGRESIAKRWGK